jgi:eukaryotic-like serine/threonine-protein kinase
MQTIHLSQLDPSAITNDCAGLVLGAQLKIGSQKRVWRCAYEEKAYVLKALMADEATLRRVKREIQVMHTCTSCYLPKFGPLPLRELHLESGETVLYFLEEYIDGIPLNSVHKPMPPEEVISLAFCITKALGVLAENRYVHRDVKPMNIIQKTGSDYVLIDAGIALDRDGEAITIPGDVVGTPLYLSPDQVRFPQKQLDSRADLFSLGVTLYECATGEHPFLNDETPRGDVIYNILQFECVPPRRNSCLRRRLRAEDALETFAVLKEDQNPQHASDQRGRDAARCHRQVKRKDVVELRSKQCQRKWHEKAEEQQQPTEDLQQEEERGEVRCADCN